MCAGQTARQRQHSKEETPQNHKTYTSISSTNAVCCLPHDAGIAGSWMISGTRTPVSQLVNFCHWPCSPVRGMFGRAIKPQAPNTHGEEHTGAPANRKPLTRMAMSTGPAVRRGQSTRPGRCRARYYRIPAKVENDVEVAVPRFQP